MTTFKVVQVKRDLEWEWMVERSPHGSAFDLEGFYLSKAEADAEADRLTKIANQSSLLTTLRGRLDAVRVSV